MSMRTKHLQIERRQAFFMVLLSLFFILVRVFQLGLAFRPISIIGFMLIPVLVYFSQKHLTNTSITAAQKQLHQALLLLTVFCILFIPLVISFLAYYPGGFNLDALSQWIQVHNKEFWDWHPVMNTLLVYLVTRIHDSLSFYIGVQIVAFCCSFLYLSHVLQKNKVPDWIIIGNAIFTAINPGTLTVLTCMYKDATFAIVMNLLVGQIIQIWFSKGEWLQRMINWLWLAFTMLGVCFMRHNGVFIVLPLLIVLFFYKQARKKLLLAVLVFALTSGIIRGPLYTALKVQSHADPVGESIGVPMAILASELILSPQTVDEETKEFLYSIASDEEWHNEFIVGEWDSIKWTAAYEKTDGVSLPFVLKLTLRSIMRSPGIALESCCNNFMVILMVSGRAYWDDRPYIEENTYGVESAPNPVLNAFINDYVDFTALPYVSTLFWCISIYWIAIISILANRLLQKDKSALLLLLPPLTYVFFTTLVLCGPSYRYFYFLVPIAIPLCVAPLLNTHNCKPVEKE